jgi:hypothetical protein
MKPSYYLETSGSNEPVPQGHTPCKLTVVYYTQCGHTNKTLLLCKEVEWGRNINLATDKVAVHSVLMNKGLKTKGGGQKNVGNLFQLCRKER